jgi:hypothetical protein
VHREKAMRGLQRNVTSSVPDAAEFGCACLDLRIYSNIVKLTGACHVPTGARQAKIYRIYSTEKF